MSPNVSKEFKSHDVTRHFLSRREYRRHIKASFGPISRNYELVYDERIILIGRDHGPGSVYTPVCTDARCASEQGRWEW